MTVMLRVSVSTEMVALPTPPLGLYWVLLPLPELPPERDIPEAPPDVPLKEPKPVVARCWAWSSSAAQRHKLATMPTYAFQLDCVFMRSFVGCDL